MKVLTASRAAKKEVMKPTAKTGTSPKLKRSRLFSRSKVVAANMMGIATKKENSVAALRDRPKMTPPSMVAPERETPGINAIDCAQPIFSACLKLMSSTVSVVGAGANFSTIRMTIPPTMRAMATVNGENR